MSRRILCLVLVSSACAVADAQEKRGPRVPTATPINLLKVKEGFRAELLYSVPKDQEGSWVSLCTDPKGRLIVSDQYGGLFRVTPPPTGKAGETQVEKIDVPLGEAQGLLWAFDSLYVMVNRGSKYDSGLYRVRDTDGDDQLDTVETLRKLDGGSEHGPHAILLSPDGKSLHVVCGNKTALPKVESSRVPLLWDEDLILPRVYGRGFMKGTPAPGGFVCKVDPEGKNWELVATGFRNEYDAAFNRDGELFAYDADMEWDMNTPWYRPTRVCHVVSGAEFGWRNGAGKWPAYYPDSVPPVVDIGPGSPTGVVFGYGAKFPKKYEDALYCCDWSYGKLYAVHLKEDGASYKADVEEFITGTPLPLTDVVVNPHDGAMYFAIGGRKVQSGLYRVTYTGGEKTKPAEKVAADESAAGLRKLRRKLESFHLEPDPKNLPVIYENLGHEDRFIRYAARVALEHLPFGQWSKKDFKKEWDTTDTRLQGLLAGVRQMRRPDAVRRQPELDTLPPNWQDGAAELRKQFDDPASAQMLRELTRDLLGDAPQYDWEKLSRRQRLDLLRVYEVAFCRLGPPTPEDREKIIARLSPHYPADSQELNYELAQLLVYLEAPDVAGRTLKLLAASPTQEEQIALAKTLRLLKNGWTMDQRREYFRWFLKAADYKGGASFGLFVQHVKDEAVAALDDKTRKALKPVIDAKPLSKPEFVEPPREFVKDWQVDDLLPLVEAGLKDRDYTSGRRLFAAGKCYACHRFNNEGGAFGPDLTAVSGRFNPRDLLESMVEPSKVVSDQYQGVKILTVDGIVVTGRIVNLSGDEFKVNTDMLDPDKLVSVDRKQIELMQPDTTSMMPKGLLNTFTQEEALDLVAYLLSRGDAGHAAFKKN